MTQPTSPKPAQPISDELLSAYLDRQVNAGERQLIEEALATDAQVQARYQNLGATVNMFQQMPPVRTPRPFVLSETQVLAAGGRVKGIEQSGFLARLFPRLMPMATAAVAAVLLMVVAVDVWSTSPLFETLQPQAAMQEIAVSEIAAPSAMPLAEEADPQAEIVAESAPLIDETALEEPEEEPAETLAMALPPEEPTTVAASSTQTVPNRATASEGRSLATATIIPTTVPMGGGADPTPVEEVAAAEMSEEMIMEEAAEMETIDEAASDAQPEALAQALDAEARSLAPPSAPPSQKETQSKRSAMPWLQPAEYILFGLFAILLLTSLLLRRRVGKRE